ncbi:MAG: metallophosphoesterase [Lachnospiraceae bacterium]|nr:metallophosphoesterase [Lachnospiraceae bacterium]
MSLPGMFFSFAIMICVLGSTHYYIARRIYQCAVYIFPKLNPWIYAGVSAFMVCFLIIGFMRSLLPFPTAVKHILGIVSSYWMGIFIYLLLFLAMTDVILFVGNIMHLIPRPMPAQIRFLSGTIAVLLTAGTASYGIYHANQVKLRTYDIQLETKVLEEEIDIVLVSDLHLGAVNSEKRLARIVQGINDLQPDLVCIAGDIFDNDYYAIHDPQKALNLLKSIRSSYGVYAVLGNHDGGKTLGEMLHFLQNSNIHVLKDESVVFDHQIILAGRLDGSPIGGFGGMSRKDYAEIMAQAAGKLPVIVMDHNPSNIDEYGRETDLVLCGHTHRGQIFPGSLFTGAMFTTDYGYYQKDSESPHIIVTSGAGTWGMPMRVGTDCEIVQIRLH